MAGSIASNASQKKSQALLHGFIVFAVFTAITTLIMWVGPWLFHPLFEKWNAEDWHRITGLPTRSYYSVRDQGVTVTATVERGTYLKTRLYEYTKGVTPYYSVHYRFPARAGGTGRGQAQLEGEYVPGEHLDVRYVPGKPWLNGPWYDGPNWLQVGIYALLLGIWGLAGFSVYKSELGQASP